MKFLSHLRALACGLAALAFVGGAALAVQTGNFPDTPPALSVNVPGQTPALAASGNVANANAVATIAAVAGKTNWLAGFELTASGATAAGCVNPTVTGLLGGTLTYVFCAPAGATAGATPLNIRFNPPLPASAVNTAIVVTLPALGSGNTNAAAVAEGWTQ